MTRAFKNNKAAGADNLLGEGGQDPRSEEGAEGRERRGEGAPLPCATGQMHGCGAPTVMKTGEPDPHTCPAPALARSTHWRKRSIPMHAAWRAHSCHNKEEGKPHTQYYT